MPAWIFKPFILFAIFVLCLFALLALIPDDIVVGHRTLHGDHQKILERMTTDREILLFKLRGPALDDGSHATINDLHLEHKDLWVKFMRQEKELQNLNTKLDLLLNLATNNINRAYTDFTKK